MFNPSYLIQSRHSIFYFRYPVGSQRVSVSLRTRCPKEALRLSKVLEYHGNALIEREPLDDARIPDRLRRCFLEVLGTGSAAITEQSSSDYRTPTSKHAHTLGAVLDSYLAEIKPILSKRGYEEQRDCLTYLVDWLGDDFFIAKLDDSRAREVKELLRSTPTGRNKLALTKAFPLVQQIDKAREHSLPTLGSTSINKYLAYFGSFLGWAKRDRYIADNPFAGMRVKAENKRTLRRDMFNKEEIGKILENLSSDELVKNKSNYWGAMIAV